MTFKEFSNHTISNEHITIRKFDSLKEPRNTFYIVFSGAINFKNKFYSKEHRDHFYNDIRISILDHSRN